MSFSTIVAFFAGALRSLRLISPAFEAVGISESFTAIPPWRDKESAMNATKN